MGQTAYNAAPDVARKGSLYSATMPRLVDGALAGENLFFGRFVKDNGDGSASLPAADAGTNKLLGVVLATLAIESLKDGSEAHYLAGDQANVIRRGAVWVWCETAFTKAADTLFVRFTANGAGLLVGQVRNDNDGGKADELNANGYGVPYRVLSADLVAAGLLAIEINMP